MKAFTIVTLSLCVASLPGLFSPAAGAELSGGAYALIGSPVAGGGTSSAERLAVTGGITTAGWRASTGGTFQLLGGLVGLYAMQETGLPALQIERIGIDQARLSWDDPDYALEFTTLLGNPGQWQSVEIEPGAMSFTAPINQPARFFRLRKR